MKEMILLTTTCNIEKQTLTNEGVDTADKICNS